jgi:hypothetical protein
MGTIGDDSATVPEHLVEEMYNPARKVNRTFHECRNTLLVLERLCFFDKINLVLQNDDVLQLHDFYGS